jgi:hypothetical protein
VELLTDAFSGHEAISTWLMDLSNVTLKTNVVVFASASRVLEPSMLWTLSS